VRGYKSRMPARFRLTSLRFNNGAEVPVPPDGVLVFVGPNNAGKSATLREVMSFFGVEPGPAGFPEVVLNDLELERSGTADALVSWLEAHSYSLLRQDGRHFRRRGGGAEGPEHQFRQEWGSTAATWGQWGHAHPPRLRVPTLSNFFMFHASADQRLGLLAGAQPHNPVTDAPSSPVQAMFANPELEQRISTICREAFGVPLHLSRLMGAELNLYLGEPSATPSIVPTDEYVQDLQRMPLLQAQGDGMRSFMGLMLALSAGQFQILLMDEPEAFLHPPQARLLGKRIATESPGTQVLVATHDVNILRGLLESGTEEVAVVRLVRHGNDNIPSLLSSERVRELWQDPVLHYSNAFEGLFHRGAVICEADTDARFYGAIADALASVERDRPHDLLFSQAGGKDRLHVLATALTAVDVPVASIVDIDILREEHGIERLVAASGGDWTPDHSRRLSQLVAGVEALGSAPPRLAVQNEINAILSGAETAGNLTRDEATEIRATLRLNDGWQLVKRGGLSSLPAGQIYEVARSLIADLAAMGIFVVTVGELERWFPEVGGHGTKWVTQTLVRGLHTRQTSAAWSFMRDVMSLFDS
jgi:ABC-type cobalamin/Fe3+-siderophores transport system ATPase subunit